MNSNSRSALIVGIVLTLAGLFFIAAQAIPGLQDLVNAQTSWVLVIEAAALLLLILGIVLGTPEMAVPATIAAGIGGILFYQVTTENWTSWSYLWTLIPGFAGVGMLISALLGARERFPWRSSFDTIGTSLILFAIFGAIFGGFKMLGPYWPLLLVAAGVLLAIRQLVRQS
ncbi:MAG TPA: hypothetical protein DDW19_04110 [Anaerolineaceae bacterium]|jgi:hypothetical protein|nr:hypothetical protein [Anaerolineaceae bacterium]